MAYRNNKVLLCLIYLMFTCAFFCRFSKRWIAIFGTRLWLFAAWATAHSVLVRPINQADFVERCCVAWCCALRIGLRLTITFQFRIFFLVRQVTIVIFTSLVGVKNDSFASIGPSDGLQWMSWALSHYISPACSLLDRPLSLPLKFPLSVFDFGFLHVRFLVQLPMLYRINWKEIARRIILYSHVWGVLHTFNVHVAASLHKI